MSLGLDQQYVGLVSSRLTRFKQIRGRLWVCRCPLCGDSAKSEKLARFYIYQNTKNGLSDYLSVFCQNCGEGMPFGKFLSDFDPDLFTEYRLEQFKENGWGRTQKPVIASVPKPVTVAPKAIQELKLAFISSLPASHPARMYINSRMFPLWVYDYLMYTDNFASDFKDFSDETINMSLPPDARIIIPFYNEYGVLQTIQGRAINPKEKLRYITLKKFESSKKLFGLDRVNKARPILVTEGPFDSLFLPNCVATADADLLTADMGTVFISDNQYRNTQICNRIDSMITLGKRVCLFPKDFPYKDINDAIIGGYTSKQLLTLIANNTFSGLRAKVEFNNLRKDLPNDKKIKVSSSPTAASLRVTLGIPVCPSD